MAKKSGQEFPHYLPKPDPRLLEWAGEYLEKLRGIKTPTQVANAARTTVEDIKKIEQGKIYHNLGCFRQILVKGYGCTLETVLAKCFETFQDIFDNGRKFERTTHYSFRRRQPGNDKTTPLLVGVILTISFGVLH